MPKENVNDRTIGKRRTHREIKILHLKVVHAFEPSKCFLRVLQHTQSMKHLLLDQRPIDRYLCLYGYTEKEMVFVSESSKLHWQP